MEKRLSPTFVELTKDALLKSFWYKPSLRLFLQQHRIKESALAQWHADQSKRDFISWLFPKLLKSPNGHGVVLDIARSLSEMQHFPDLERREDTKYLIPEAQIAITRLREQVGKINETLQEAKDAEQRRKVAQEEFLKRLTSQRNIDELQERLDKMTPLLGTQSGGYAFERWFYDLAVYYELDSRPGYVADGRQIDGALTMEGTTYLIETKFTNEPIGSPAVDIFMARIESKSDNTMGLFVSMSGFTSGAVQAASKQRTPMLLLDYTHIYSLILPGIMTLSQVINRIKRHASQTGRAYLIATEF